MRFLQKNETGSATLEYVFVTIFGLILTASAMKIIHKIYERKIRDVSSQLGLEVEIDPPSFEGIF